MTETSPGESGGPMEIDSRVRYTGKIERLTRAVSQAKIDRTRESVLCYTKKRVRWRKERRGGGE